jgi:predicted ATPase/class 3 adenylate cyclase
MADLPSGTLTYLFSDIEASTRLWEEHPDDAPAMLARHDELIESQVARFGGSVVRPRGEGDSRFCVFTRASDAVAAAAAVQIAFNEEPWKWPFAVRVALHTGEAELRDGDYYGSAVNRCARIRAVAHGGQTLISSATEELVRDALPEGATLRDLGGHRLRDLSAPVHLFQVCHPALRDGFPRLNSLDANANNLPVQLTSFVGRESDVGDIRDLVDKNRLVTLTGAAGCGKTRLALQAAAELVHSFPDGAWFVDLAPLADPAVVPDAIARTLGLQQEEGKELMATVIDSLSARHLLLVLDNCEHLLSASAGAVNEILLSCPHVSVLATGREALGVGGETTWRVPSLSLPTDTDDLAALAESEASNLFIERARSASSTLKLTDDDAPAIAKICARLDGIPLAIELAAARIRMLSPSEIYEGLSDMFRLLTGGSRTALERQQTLRAAVDWSFGLLTDPEKVLLRRLSVFAGGFTLESCDAVCSDPGVSRAETMDTLSALVDKSLVVVERAEGATRYRLLETMRQYARERLLDSEDRLDARTRHLAWVAALAARADLRGPDQLTWFRQLDAEHDNIRVALEWALSGDAGTALSLINDVALFWEVRGHWGEGKAWIEAALALEGGADLTRGWTLFWATHFAWLHNDFAASEAFTSEAEQIARSCGDERLSAWVLMRRHLLATVAARPEEALEFWNQSMAIAEDIADRTLVIRLLNNRALTTRDLQEGTELIERAVAVAREMGDVGSIGTTLQALGMYANANAEYARARVILREALEYLRPIGHKRAIASTVESLAVADFFQVEYESARPLYEEATSIARELGGPVAESTMLNNEAAIAMMDEDYGRASERFAAYAALAERLGAKSAHSWALFLSGLNALLAHRVAEARQKLERSIATQRELLDPSSIVAPLTILSRIEVLEGNIDQARTLCLESLRLVRTGGTPMNKMRCVERYAEVEVALGRGDRAARLLGAGAALRERAQIPIWPSDREWYDESVAGAQALCGEGAYGSEWAKGHAMSIDDAIDYALEEDG